VENMAVMPDAMFVIDPGAETIAVREARRMGVPVVAIVDTNCDPDLVDAVIPGNDDALRAIRLFTSKIADAVIAGRESYEQSQVAQEKNLEGGDKGETLEYVDTSAYEVYERPEGDFAEAKPAGEVFDSAAAAETDGTGGSSPVMAAASATNAQAPAERVPSVETHAPSEVPASEPHPVS
jgi:small subunit ribosomal protein S2